ncbi:MAG: phytanoyl-CoA dioxygenase family protein [Opitutaceae bacterium]|nr:phytanoyl-CoA dioxygenase family protein [Opitutaceae bacterium]
MLHARRTILTHMQEQKKLTPGTPVLEGVMPAEGRSVGMMGRKGIAHHPDITAVLEAPELYRFFESYFGEPALTYSYKWLRAVGNEDYTGAHYDTVYMGRGTKKLHTVWVPFGDLGLEQGTLAMCRGSNQLDSFSRLRETYGQVDVDRDLIEGWFTRDPMEIVEKFGGQWVIGDYCAGDVIIFGMHTMHASSTNLTNCFRLSCDIRFQPASEPVDERWTKEGIGHNPGGEQIRSMATARKNWGL